MPTIVHHAPNPPDGSGGVSRDRQRLAAVILAVTLAISGMVLAHLGGAATFVRAGAGGVDPLSYLGSTLNRSGCVSAPLGVGDGMYVGCEDWSAITSPAGAAMVVSVFADGNSAIAPYTGTLPKSLRWHETVTEVWAALGRPRRISSMYGTPTLVYMYDHERFGSLELQFDARDQLVRINACLTH
jgi:hypothetical protein